MTQTAQIPTPAPAGPAPAGTCPGSRVVRSSPEDLAYRTASHLRDALIAAGFDADRDFPTLRGDVTSSGEPFIAFGRIRPGVAERFAALLLNQPPGPCAAAAAGRPAGAQGTDSGAV